MRTWVLEEADIYTVIHNIAILITALSAFKVGLSDLIRKPRAFSMI